MNAFPHQLFHFLSALFFPRLRRSLFLALACLTVGVVCLQATAQTAARFSYALETVGNSMNSPTGVAVDISGNVYVADKANNRVIKLPWTGSGYGPQTTVGTGLSQPYGVAVDASGNVYITDSGHYRVLKETPSGGSYTQTVVIDQTIDSNLNELYSVAVDASGNVYFTDYGSNRVLKVPWTGSSYGPDTVVANIPSIPVTVDSSGNVYISDITDNNVLKVAWNGSSYSAPTTVLTGLNQFCGLAIDSGNNLYIANTYNDEILTAKWNGSTYSSPVQIAFGGPVNLPSGVTVDSYGNVYVADTGDDRALKLQTVGVNFYTVPVRTTSPKQSLTFTFSSAGTFGSVAVLTQGAPGLDFADAGTGTCTTNGSSHSYAIGDTCTVDVTFTPTVPGQRNGAVGLKDTSGNAIATGNIYGIGSGPQVAFAPLVRTTLQSGGGNYNFNGVTVDGSGNVYYTTFSGSGSILKMPFSNGSYGTPTLVANVYQAGALAVDGAGNVYVAAWSSDSILKFPWTGSGYGAPLSVGTGIARLSGVAVDGSGNVYATGVFANTAYKIPWTGSGYGTQTTIGTGFVGATGVKVDGYGNVYIADTNNSRIVKLPWTGSGYGAQITVASGFSSPYGPAIDANGNIYVADVNGSRVSEVPWNGSSYGTPTLVASGVYARDVALDGNGNLYVVDTVYGYIYKYGDTTPPTLNFASTHIGSTSTDSPKTATITNIGNADLTFTSFAFAPTPSDFAQGSGETCDGLTDAILTANTSCVLSVNFTPQSASPSARTGNLVLTDDNLNAPATALATQQIPLSGTATSVSITTALSLSTSNTISYGTAVTLTADVSPNSVGATLAGGTITFKDGAAVLGTITLPQSGAPQGEASITIPASGATAFTVGSHTLTAVYSGDTNFNTSTGTASLTVNVATVAVALISSDNPSNHGESVTFTATVSPTGTGTIQFFDGASPLGSPVTVASGVATYTTSSLVLGTHPITASYSGDGSHAAATSGVLSQNVLQAVLTVTVSSATRTYGQPNPTFNYAITGFIGSDTELNSVTGVPSILTGATQDSNAGSYAIQAALGTLSSINYSFVFVNGTLTITKATPGGGGLSAVAVSSSQNPSTWGSAVQFTAQLPPNATGTVNFFDNATLIGTAQAVNDMAVLTTSSLTLATHPITAVYLGDANYNGATSAALNQIVNKAALIVAANNAQRVYGQPNPALTTIITGFVNGDTAAVVSGAPAVTTTATVSSPSGTYPITPTQGTLAAANYTFNFLNGALLVTQATGTVVITSSTNPVTLGVPVTFTATVPTAATGTVTFYDSAAVLGTSPVVNGVATLTAASLSVGSHSITASYSGDTDFTTATSSLITETVVAVATDFTVASTIGKHLIAPGASVSYPIVVSSVGAPFNNPVTLTVTGLPSGASYSYSSATVTPGTGGANSTLTISVPRQTAALHHSTHTPFALAVLLLPLAALKRFRRHPYRLMLWLVMLTAIGATTGCGAGGYFSQSEQTYTITVTGTSGNLVHSTTVTLTVE